MIFYKINGEKDDFNNAIDLIKEQRNKQLNFYKEDKVKFKVSLIIFLVGLAIILVIGLLGISNNLGFYIESFPVIDYIKVIIIIVLGLGCFIFPFVVYKKKGKEFMNSKKSIPIILGYYYIVIPIFIVLLNKTLSKIIINGILKVFSLFISPIGIGIICLGLIITLLIRKKKMQSQRYKKRRQFRRLFEL